MADSKLNSFEEKVEKAFPFEKWKNVLTVLSVSGGPDSMALCRSVLAIANKLADGNSPNVILGHVNHGTRGMDSDADEAFVRAIASEFQIPIEVQRVELASSLSEESLRKARYEALIHMAGQTGARYVFTGHNLDDQVETILFRIFRGTGLRGLAGIPMTRPLNDHVTTVRPLLEIGRAEIIEYLEEVNQDFRVDKSNEDSKYTRNFLRHEIVPQLQERFGASLDQSIVRLSNQASEANAFLNEHAGLLLNSAILNENKTLLEIDRKRLIGVPELIIRHWLTERWAVNQWPLKGMNFQWWERVALQIRDGAQGDVLNLPGNIRLALDGELAIFSVNLAD